MRFDSANHILHAGGRSWRADPDGTEIHDNVSGTFDGRTFAHRRRRCLVRFESGWSASITWGTNSYSSNHGVLYDDEPFAEKPSLVEVGVLDRSGQLRMRRHSDDELEWHEVEAYLDDAALVELLDRLAELPCDYDYGDAPPPIEHVEEMLKQYLEADRG